MTPARTENRLDLDPQLKGRLTNKEGGAQAPLTIDLPENAYLDRSGNRWSCNQGFRLSDGTCIVGR